MRCEPRVAFVTDALPAIGGAEKTLFAALECFPAADLFTLIYNKPVFINSPLQGRRVITSFLNELPAARKYHRLFLPLMPRAIEGFDLDPYDIVVSFSYAVANGAKAQNARHLSYTHTPMRYAWNGLNIGGKSRGNHLVINQYLQAFRRWDQAAASRIHAFAAVSNDIARKIRSAYDRKAQVIYPPVEVDRFHGCEKRDRYYVVVSRLVAHKRIDLVVDAFSALRLPLKIIGDGPEKQKLMRRAADNIEFLGFQPDLRVAEILSRARAFICASDEDFGIAAVEAQAAGCPVIGYGQSGLLETVINGRTGLFFPQQSVECLTGAVRAFEAMPSSFNTQEIVANARRFDKTVFQREFQQFVTGSTQT